MMLKVNGAHFVRFSALCAMFSFAHAGSYDDMFQAAQLDDVDTARSLLYRGVPPDLTNPEGNTVLMMAARAGSLGLVKELLAWGAKPGLRNIHGENALMLAALEGHYEIAKALVRAGVEINPEPRRWAPLMYACFNGNLAMARLLLDGGAKIDAQSPNGSTALMFAAMHGAENVVSLLLSRGADVRIQNDAGKTAIDFALSRRNTDIARSIEAAMDGSEMPLKIDERLVGPESRELGGHENSSN